MTNDFFSSYQAQFEESRKQMMGLWEESQNQVVESQKKLIDIWMNASPGSMGQMNVSDNVEKTLNFQRELVNVGLNTQKAFADLAIATQRQFWENYFQTAQMMRTPQSRP